MDAVVPWARVHSLLEPHYSKLTPKGGRPPMPLETVLRIYFLQNWYALSDRTAEETLYNSEAMRRFAGIELGNDHIPEEITILNFRHLLERHGQTEAIFADVSSHLADKGDHATLWHAGRCNDYRCAVFDQEPSQGAGPRDVFDKEGQ